eukprot:TRINITY_DN13709_c0_g1_i1.p1 TRINITY_DN13709_c0_g1~~TRINITY_DN13709_c0_g1_i1.p1  ORF type:complete len:189 (+),score=49.19 TRINITY_DN13709_c0_g1_i1:65-568(+)
MFLAILPILSAALVSVDECQGNATVTACDVSWGSRLNQTFAYFEVAQGDVQLRAYWGNQYGCLAKEANDTLFRLSAESCNLKSSVWSYGPTTIKNYVYYTNAEQSAQCLTASGPFNLSLAPCCHLGPPATCTSVQTNSQLFLEPPTTHNPYNTIQTDTRLCLTRCVA